MPIEADGSMGQNTDQSIDRSAQLLEEILALAHPLMAEAITIATIPHWYDLPLFSAIRAVDDGRNEGLIPRLASYSFVIPIPDVEIATYRVRNEERVFLNRRWIANDCATYLTAQKNAFIYCDTHSELHEQTFAHDRLYHHLFVDFERATNELIQLFRTYATERHLAAIENMLDMVAEAHAYLQLIHQANADKGDENSGPASLTELAQFEDLLRYLRARLAQLHGNWNQSLGLLQQLRNRDDLSPVLLPFVTRAYGNTLTQSGNYTEAIRQLESAIKQFDERLEQPVSTTDRSTALTADNSEAERAYAMIDLGEAYVNFAISARGGAADNEMRQGVWRYLQAFWDFLLSGPLIIYLSAYLGMRVWHPRFWPTLRNLDWMVARLFAAGAYYFQKADPILERTGTPTEGIVADERLAFLFLNMGDAAQAQWHFSRLLAEEDAPLGDYHRARVQVGLSEAYLRLDQPGATAELLYEALPTIETFADQPLEAEAQSLLAEASLRMGDHQRAQEHLAEAIRTYVAFGDVASATDLVERCDLLSQTASPAADSGATSAADENPPSPNDEVDYRKFGAQLPFRQYPVGYRHPTLVLFRRLVIFLLPLTVVLALLGTIQLDTDISLVPTIEYRAAPLLDPAETTPAKLSQGVTAASLDVVRNPSALLSLALSGVTGYMGLSLLIGVFVIAFTSLKSVQESSLRTTVRVDEDGLTEGEGDDQKSVRWADVRKFALADVRIWRGIIPSASSFGLDTESERLVVGGNAKWYEGLQKEVEAHLPTSAQRVTLGYSVIRTRLGVLYLLNLALLVALALFAWLRPESRFLWQDLLGIYSIVDLYPYLYAGLFLIPLWWGVVCPLRITSRLGTRGRFARVTIVCALLIFAILLLLFFRPIFTVPDLYPTLIVLVALISAGIAIWSLQEGGRPVYPIWKRVTLIVLLALPSFLLISIAQREVRSYHFLIVGNSFRDRGQDEGLPEEEKRDLNTNAVQAYSRAIEIGRGRIGPFSGDRMINHPLGFSNPFGIPSQESVSWLAALKNRAALQAQQGNEIAAISDYTLLREFTNKPDQVYAWQAVARQSAATAAMADNEEQIRTSESAYIGALDDYHNAIELNPDEPKYYLWRGATYHTIGGTNNLRLALVDYETVLEPRMNANPVTRERAFSGIGWVWYDVAEKSSNQEDRIRFFGRAENAFIRATRENPKEAEAWLGLGYARYAAGELGSESPEEAIKRLQKAQAAWERANSEDPKDPVVLISLGTLHWKIGGKRIKSGEIVEGCDEYVRSLERFTEATERDKLRPQTDHDVAFTYRTRGQIFFLLGRNCNKIENQPYGTRAENYRLGALSYAEAIELEPSNAFYIHMRARLNYAHLLVDEPPAADAVELILEILSDMNRALEIDPVDNVAPRRDYKPHRFSQLIVPWAFAQARELLQDGLDTEAQQIYNDAITLANKIEGGINLLNMEVSKLSDYLRQQPSRQGSEILQQLRDAISTLTDQNPIGHFYQGANALAAGDSNRAISFYRLGLEALDDSIQIGPARDALIDLLTEHGDSRAIDEIVQIFQDALPRLNTLIEQAPSVTDLTALGSIALATNEFTQAGDLYAAAIQINAQDENQQYATLRNSWRDWRTIWQARGSNADEFLQALQDRLTWRLEQDPKLGELEYYWGVRAWFKYWIGRAAFRVEDEAAARRALQWAQPDADRAFESNGWISGDEVHTYLPESAWGWYHVERGNDRFDEGDFAAAFADYEAAASLIQPQKNQTAREEAAIAAFKAGRAAVALENLVEAAKFYTLGRERTAIAEAPSIAAKAATELNELLAELQDDAYSSGKRGNRSWRRAVRTLFEALIDLSLYAIEEQDVEQAEEWLLNADMFASSVSGAIERTVRIEATIESLQLAVDASNLDKEVKESLLKDVEKIFQNIQD